MSRELTIIGKYHHNIRPCGKCGEEFKIGEEAVIDIQRGSRIYPRHRKCYVDGKGEQII